MNLQDRFIGCLLGNAIGDALGSPMEWLSHGDLMGARITGHLDHYVDIERRITEMMPGSAIAHSTAKIEKQNKKWRPSRQKGWTTDDNLFTMILAESIMHKSSLDMDYFSERLADLDMVDMGKTTKRAIKALNRYAIIPEVWKITGREVSKRSLRDKGWPKGRIESNGGLMRVAPIGLYRANSTPELISRDAILSTMITHDSDVCAWSSAFVAQVIANVVNGNSKELSVELAAFEVHQDGSVLKLFDEPYEAKLWHTIGGDKIYRHLERHHVTINGLAAVANAAYDCLEGRHGDPKPGESKIGINKVGSKKDFHYVLHTLRIATHYFLHTDSFEEALIQCVNHGGDTDTNAAVCGAMAGAFYGADAIPERWVEQLNVDAPTEDIPKLYYSVLEIETIAKKLYLQTEVTRPCPVMMVP